MAKRWMIRALTFVCVTYGLWFWLIDLLEGFVPLQNIGSEG